MFLTFVDKIQNIKDKIGKTIYLPEEWHEKVAEKFNISDIQDAIQGNSDNGSKSLINSLAEMYIEEKLTLEQVKSQIDEKNYEALNRTIMQMKYIRNDK